MPSTLLVCCYCQPDSTRSLQSQPCPAQEEGAVDPPDSMLQRLAVDRRREEQADRRREEQADRRREEEADERRQAGSGASMVAGAGLGSGFNRTMETHLLLAEMRARHGHKISGHKHRGLFTGEPRALGAHDIKYGNLRNQLVRHCIVHQVPVSIAKLKAIIRPERDLAYIKRMTAECRKLERKRGSGQRIKSVEGEDLLWHIPQGMTFGGFEFKNKSHKRFCGKAIPLALEKLFQTQGRALPSKKSHKWRYKFTPPGPDKSLRHQLGDVRKNEGLGEADEMVLHFGVWPSTGYRTFGLTGDTNQKTSTGKETISQFYSDMTEPLHIIGSLFEACCPDAYKDYEDIYVRAMDRGGTRNLAVSDRQVFCTMAILYNAQLDPHKDSGDIVDGWVAMTCVGAFEGGWLVLPELGIQIEYKPGDVVFLRSSLVEHFISDYTGHRTSLVLFTKGTVKQWLEMQPETDQVSWISQQMEQIHKALEKEEREAGVEVKVERVATGSSGVKREATGEPVLKKAKIV